MNDNKNINESLGYTHLSMILSYFSLEDIMKYRLVSRLWNQSFESSLYAITQFTIKNNPNDISLYYFLIKKSPNLSHLTLLNYGDIPFDHLLSLLSYTNSKIKTFELLHRSDEENEITELLAHVSIAFPNLDSIIMLGKTFGEMGIFNLKKIKYLEHLAFTDDPFFEGKYLKELNPLKSIQLNAFRIPFSNIEGLLDKSLPILERIKLDIENYEAYELDNLTKKLATCRLKQIEFNYCENLGSLHVQNIGYHPQLEKFVLHKADYVDSEAYSYLLDHKYPYLTDISFQMNCGLSDEGVRLIAKNCPNLKNLDISWCEKVRNLSVFEVLLNCPLLEQLNIVGLKYINEEGFPVLQQILNALNDKKAIYETSKHSEIRTMAQTIDHGYPSFKCYRHLKMINTSKCDFIPDEILYIIKILNPNCIVLNYYSEQIMFNASESSI